MIAKLVMFKADGTRKDFTVKDDRQYIIGRKETCDLRIPMNNVSREHAAIFFDKEDDELVIKDLGSSNGTYVNQEKIIELDLCPGDVIFVGSVALQVVIDGYPKEVKPILRKAESETQEDEEKVIPVEQPSAGEADQISLSDSSVTQVTDSEVIMPDESGSFFDVDSEEED